MRIHNSKWNIVGRKLTVLLLLCGLLLPCLQWTNAASITYEYTWIVDASGLPRDDQWHDYFIAWEDTDVDDKWWFADYHWYTPDGYNNYDAGGSHWMEYRAASTLSNTTASTFSSMDSWGHMQIKYAGIDSDNDNSPMYYIRVSKMNGGYMYFTEYEPTSSPNSAEPFTFQDKGDVFHIFVNISGKADRYLTRDGQNLETTESSSYGGGEYYRPLRVYRRTYTIGEEEVPKDVIGKVTLYEYEWINTADEILAIANSKEWTDIMLAWEDADGEGTSNPDKVWCAKEVWYDEEGNPNYRNGKTEFEYFANDYLGSDGYGSPYAEAFTLPSKVGHFQIKHVGWDDGNPLDGYVDASGKTVDSPIFHFRFDIGRGKYIYIGNNYFEEDPDDAEDFTVQLRLDEDNSEDIYGSFHIFVNIGGGRSDENFTRAGNRLDISDYWRSGHWEFPFRIYTFRPVEYDAIVKSFSVGRGATYSIDKQLIVNQGVTITVEDGGVLTVDKSLLNNGKIVVKNGGTVIVNEDAYIMAYDPKADGTISLSGGNLLILDGAKVICDQNGGTLQMDSASTILNRGFLLVGKSLVMNHNSVLKNESMGTLALGGNITRERGGVDAFSFDEIINRLHQFKCTKLISDNSKIVNNGRIVELEMKENIDTNVPSLKPNGNGSIRR